METRCANESINGAAREGLIELKLSVPGWMAVKKLDECTLNSWRAVAERMKEYGMITIFRKGRPTSPDNIEDHQ